MADRLGVKASPVIANVVTYTLCGLCNRSIDMAFLCSYNCADDGVRPDLRKGKIQFVEYHRTTALARESEALREIGRLTDDPNVGQDSFILAWEIICKVHQLASNALTPTTGSA